MSKRRVVITGLGMVTPIGLNVTDTWQAALQGQSGAVLIDHFDTSDLPVRIAATVKNFDAAQCLPEQMPVKEFRKMDLFIQYGIAAAAQAVKDSGLIVTPEIAHRVGVSIGSGIGGLPLIERSHDTVVNNGFKRLSPFFVPGAIINMISGHVSILYGAKGPNVAIVTACTTGTHNIGYAARTIAYGDADVMIAGGSEMATSLLGVAGFAAMRALSRRNDDPARASRPWDKDRDGFVLGEGAGVVVLEEYEHAKKRGAHIYAELAGFGMSADASHITHPEGEGAVNSMLNALKDAGLNPQQIDYINAHGTSTPAGDVIEAQAIKQAFGTHAHKLAISSTKSMIGHLLGAAGAVEAIFSILAIRDQIAPPTINLENPDEGCDLDFIPNHAREMKTDITLSNSFGFGGTNGSLIFKRV